MCFEPVGILARMTDSDKEDMNKHQFGYIRYFVVVTVLLLVTSLVNVKYLIYIFIVCYSTMLFTELL